MSNELADSLTPDAGALRWVRGRVTAITGLTLTISLDGGSVAKCAYLDSYAPTVGDLVHGLLQQGRGLLVLGSDNAPVTASAGDPPPEPYELAPAQWRTAVHVPGTDSTEVQRWENGEPIRMSSTETGWWFYDQAGLRGIPEQVSRVEVLVSRRLGSGPPEFRLMPFGDYRFTAREMPEANTPTWLALPAAWGEVMRLSGEHAAPAAIALTSEMYSGAYSGGALRFHP